MPSILRRRDAKEMLVVSVNWYSNVIQQTEFNGAKFDKKCRSKKLLGRRKSRCEIKQKLGLSLYQAPIHQKLRRSGEKPPSIIEGRDAFIKHC